MSHCSRHVYSYGDTLWHRHKMLKHLSHREMFAEMLLTCSGLRTVNMLLSSPVLHHETSSIKRTEFKDHWMLICGRFSREPVNYKILHCALPTKSWAVRFNCSSSFIFCTISCDSFMIFKINYKICHLRTYILVWDINTSILYFSYFYSSEGIQNEDHDPRKRKLP